MGKKIRLQVALAQLGFASRRGAAEIIKAGRAEVNGRVVVQPGLRVDLEKDAITAEGRSSCIQKKAYLMLNKPKGVVSTVKDKHAAETVLSIIKPKNLRVYPVGRLDKDTTGLLLLTNDGELAYRLMHPKFGVKRVYQVCVKGTISQKKIKKLQTGILLEGKKTFPCKIKPVAFKNQLSSLEVELSEGRKRQIKKMFAAFGHNVVSIRRVAFGSLKLANLKAGQWRALKEQEIAELKEEIGTRR